MDKRNLEVNPEGNYPLPSSEEEAREVLELRKSLDNHSSYQTPGLMTAEEMFFCTSTKRREKFTRERLDVGMSSPDFPKGSVFTHLGNHPHDRYKTKFGRKHKNKEVNSHFFHPVSTIPASPPSSPNKPKWSQ